MLGPRTSTLLFTTYEFRIFGPPKKKAWKLKFMGPLSISSLLDIYFPRYKGRNQSQVQEVSSLSLEQKSM